MKNTKVIQLSIMFLMHHLLTGCGNSKSLKPIPTPLPLPAIIPYSAPPEPSPTVTPSPSPTSETTATCESIEISEVPKIAIDQLGNAFGLSTPFYINATILNVPSSRPTYTLGSTEGPFNHTGIGIRTQNTTTVLKIRGQLSTKNSTISILLNEQIICNKEVSAVTVSRNVLQLADLIIVSVAAPANSYHAVNTTVDYLITVKNQGNVKSNSSALAIYNNVVATPTTAEKTNLFELPALDAGDSIQVAVSTVYPFASVKKTWFKLDYDGKVNESNETNNMAGPISLTVY